MPPCSAGLAILVSSVFPVLDKNPMGVGLIIRHKVIENFTYGVLVNEDNIPGIVNKTYIPKVYLGDNRPGYNILNTSRKKKSLPMPLNSISAFLNYHPRYKMKYLLIYAERLSISMIGLETY
ncbi:MAG TPA: hypothetical protein VLZ28_09395 [Daejeonella sp.]|nr:hypothetical protein [Daejeonella sp.]